MVGTIRNGRIHAFDHNTVVEPVLEAFHASASFSDFRMISSRALVFLEEAFAPRRSRSWKAANLLGATVGGFSAAARPKEPTPLLKSTASAWTSLTPPRGLDLALQLPPSPFFVVHLVLRLLSIAACLAKAAGLSSTQAMYQPFSVSSTTLARLAEVLPKFVSVSHFVAFMWTWCLSAIYS